ncbi:MAG: hypothetical protein K2P58_04600 [Hyphomonadaceae bacterium]|nr:hypothetical protein [Hyphomonadaceae bacterium]
MVSSVNPSASVNVRGVDLRPQERPASQPLSGGQSPADRVDAATTLNAARESVRNGISQLHQALALGHDAQATLVRAQSLVRDGAGGQAQLSSVLADYQSRLDTQLAQGARVAIGEDVLIDAEPGASALAIGGVDLRLGGAVIEVGVDARIDAPGLGEALQRSMDRLQEAMSRLLDSARALEAHQGFLSAAVGASASVRHDLDADGARLLALQARQGLEAVRDMSIANVEPQAVLAHFRA